MRSRVIGSRDAPSRNRERLARGWGAACLLVLPALLLGSCMMQSDARAVAENATPEQARTELTALLDDTQDLLGGTWTDHDDASTRECAVRWGVAGETYGALRIGPAPTSAGVAAWVQRAWERRGYQVESTDIGSVTQLVATPEGGAGRELLIFRVSALAMTLQGESACRPVQ